MRFLEANDGKLPELRPRSIYMPFWERHNLDILAGVASVLLLSAYLSLCLMCKLIRLVRGGGGKKEKKKKE